MSSIIRREMLETLTKAENVKPVMMEGDKPIYTFEQVVATANGQLLERKIGAVDEEIGIRQLNPNGDTYPSSKKGPAATNLGLYLNNRYRMEQKQLKPGAKKVSVYEIVTDFTALQALGSGAVPPDNTMVYEFHVTASNKANDDEPKIEFIQSKFVTAQELTLEFKNKLKPQTMAKFKALLADKVDSRQVSMDDLKI